jgi:propionate CoA-transferase
MSKIISSDMAAYLIADEATVIPGGFGCCGHPESITKAIEKRFYQTGKPKNITLLFAAGPGDRKDKGINRLALPGLVSKVIGGFWGFVPSLGKAAMEGSIEAHNWPQGVISKLYRCIASGEDGLISPIGLGTFIDPRQDGGVINNRTIPMVELIEFRGKEKLFYPSLPIDFAYIRATTADEFGNLTMEEEVSLQDALSQAQAAHNSGGIVVAQVKKMLLAGQQDPLMVKVPGSLVDYIVIAKDSDDHNQTYDGHYNSNYTTAGSSFFDENKDREINARSLIVKRASKELDSADFEPYPIINLGIGIPAEIGNFLGNYSKVKPTLTVEGGAFGGKPAHGLSFGASEFPDAIIDQNSLFDLYDGGGINASFLGFAEVDKNGNINVSRYKGRLPGVGGFVNISQTAKKIFFCGTFTTDGLEIEVDIDRGELKIIKEGRTKKFINRVEQISFNGSLNEINGRPARVITERAVFDILNGQLVLSEIAYGIDIDRDIKPHVGFPLIINKSGLKITKINI